MVSPAFMVGLLSPLLSERGSVVWLVRCLHPDLDGPRVLGAAGASSQVANLPSVIDHVLNLVAGHWFSPLV